MGKDNDIQVAPQQQQQQQYQQQQFQPQQQQQYQQLNAPPPYEYNPEAHPTAYAGGLYIQNTFITSDAADEAQSHALKRWEAKWANQVDKYSDTVLKWVLLPMTLCGFEAAIHDTEVYSRACETAKSAFPPNEAEKLAKMLGSSFSGLLEKLSFDEGPEMATLEEQIQALMNSNDPAIQPLKETLTHLSQYTQATVDAVCDDLKQYAFLTPEQWKSVNSALPYIFATIVATMLYQMNVGERKVQNFLVRQLRDAELINESSMKGFQKSFAPTIAMLARTMSIVCVAVGGSYIAQNDTLLVGAALITCSSVFDGLRASAESGHMEKLWTANYSTPFIPADGYTLQNYIRRSAIVPALTGLMLGGFIIAGLRDQRDAQDDSTADEIVRNDYITQTLAMSLLFRQMIIHLTAWPLDDHKYAVLERLVRENEDLRGIEVNTTTLFGMRLNLSTAYQALDLISKSAIAGAAAFYTYQAQNEADDNPDVFPKAFVGVLAGGVALACMGKWNSSMAKVGAQINKNLMEHFKDAHKYAPVTEYAGHAWNYLRETAPVRTVTGWVWQQNAGQSQPLLNRNQPSANTATTEEDMYAFGKAVKRNDL